MKNYDVVIIGGGAAGLSSSISLKEKGYDNILLIEAQKQLGGVLTQCIHHGFGLHHFKEELTGPSYAQKLIDQANELNVEYKVNTFVNNISDDKVVTFINDEGEINVQAKAIILTTGSLERSAGKINLAGMRLKGIYTAGLAQRYINEYGNLVGKKVFILGSGDIGLIMARRMTLEGAEVLGVAEIMPYSNGLNRNVVQCLEDFDIPLYLSHTITDVRGTKSVEEIEISEVDSQMKPIIGTEKNFAADTLLLSVGLIPNIGLTQEMEINRNFQTKSLDIDSTYQTSKDGIFVCGNALHIHDIVDFVSKEAEICVEYVGDYLEKKTLKSEKYVTLETDSNLNYILPTKINLSNLKEEINLFFRPRRILKNCQLQVLNENAEVVYKRRKKIILPAEMEKINLKTEKIKDCTKLTVKIIDLEEN